MPFQPGKSGNPSGRPKKAEQEGKLEEFRSHFSNGRWKLLLDCIDYRLERRDLKAAELALKYVVGLPNQTVDLNQTGDVRVTVVYERAVDKTT